MLPKEQSWKLGMDKKTRNSTQVSLNDSNQVTCCLWMKIPGPENFIAYTNFCLVTTYKQIKFWSLDNKMDRKLCPELMYEWPTIAYFKVQYARGPQEDSVMIVFGNTKILLIGWLVKQRSRTINFHESDLHQYRPWALIFSNEINTKHGNHYSTKDILKSIKFATIHTHTYVHNRK